MEAGSMDPVDLSAEAALELEELKQGVRKDVPALGTLFRVLKTPAQAFAGESVSMLGDVRSYALLRDSLGTKGKSSNLAEFRKAAEQYLDDLEAGVAKGAKGKIEEARRFCLAFNEKLLEKQMLEIYGRRESSDSRYVSHESIL